MSRTRRVLIPPAAPGDRIRIAEDEARHLVRVLRARPGDAVTAVDPSGRGFHAVVDAAVPEGTWLRIADPVEEDLATAQGPTLIVAPPKGTRMAWLVEKAVELGAGVIIPIATVRGAVRPGGESQTGRWRRIAAAAVKQSGASPPEIRSMGPLADVLRGLDRPLLAAHPDPRALSFHAALPAGTVPAFAVGPEGGWTQEELAELEKAGARFVHLGSSILRVETAALALLAAWTLEKS